MTLTLLLQLTHEEQLFAHVQPVPDAPAAVEHTQEAPATILVPNEEPENT